MKKENWLTNGNPAPFPESEDGWKHTKEQWIDNGHPGEFPKPEDGWI